MSIINKYQQPMLPWPDLKDHAKIIEIFNGELSLFFYEMGDQNPLSLVLIHGLGDEADTWRHIIHPLADDYHVLAFDLPGFGRSDLPERKITLVFLLNCLKEFLHKRGVERPILIGNSLGGVLAHAYALKYSEQILGLVLVGGSLLQVDPMGNFALRLMQIPLLGEWVYSRLRKNPQAAFDSLKNVYHALDQLPEADQKFLFTRVNQRVWSDKQRKAYFATLRNLSPWIKACQADLPGQLEDFRLPTLVLRGEFDSLFSEINAKGVVSVQPNATLHEISSAGHLPHQETPEAFLTVLQEWLEKMIN